MGAALALGQRLDGDAAADIRFLSSLPLFLFLPGLGGSRGALLDESMRRRVRRWEQPAATFADHSRPLNGNLEAA